MRWSRNNVFVLAIFVLVGCVLGTNVGYAESLMERAKREGIRLALFNERPFAYVDENDQLTGSDPAIARALLARMGITEIKPVVTQFQSLISGLVARRFDIIAAGLSIRPKRCEHVAFSEPYFAHGDGFLVKAGNPLNLHSYTDVAENDEVILAFVTGGVEREHALAMGIPESRLVPYTDGSSAIAGIKTGRIQAFATPAISIQALVDTAQDPSIERAMPFEDPVIDGKVVKNYSGFAFRKEDQDFLDIYNLHVKEFVGSEAYLKLVRPFGFTKAEAPGIHPTTAEICQGN